MTKLELAYLGLVLLSCAGLLLCAGALFVVGKALGRQVDEVKALQARIEGIEDRSTAAVKVACKAMRRLGQVESELTERRADVDELRERVGDVELKAEGQGQWLRSVEERVGRLIRRRHKTVVPLTKGGSVVARSYGGRTLTLRDAQG
ncbi:hypothetical protein [Chitinimonas lacunae]|uniref:DUF948 domain-containing protein n=1 Tax=Chitinimonas lacunae TaxID=1963018 RepID=A0ABV8MN38_9NEIS